MANRFSGGRHTCTCQQDEMDRHVKCQLCFAAGRSLAAAGLGPPPGACLFRVIAGSRGRGVAYRSRVSSDTPASTSAAAP